MAATITRVDLTDEKITQLRQKISDVFGSRNFDWCVACGAGAMALRELLTSQPQALKELTSESTVAAAVNHVKIDNLTLATDWCVACGAAAKTSVSDLGMPSPQLDQVIADVEKILRA